MERFKDVAKESNKKSYLFAHLKIGYKNLFKPINWLKIIIPIILIYLYMMFFNYFGYLLKNNLRVLSLKFIGFVVFVLIEIYIFLNVLGYTRKAMEIEDALQSIGLVNHIGSPSYLVSYEEDETNKNKLILKFKANYISIPKWEENRDSIEQALNITFSDIHYEEGKEIIVLECSNANYVLPTRIFWNNKYIDKLISKYVVGEGIVGPIYVDLDIIPHVIIGGSTGSGKTQLLRFFLMQAINKNEKVFIADLKGGIDYQGKWREKAYLCTTIDDVIKVLNILLEELEKRKKLLESTNCHNITEYNERYKKDIKRIVFACDEIAELLDTTGLDKEEKEKIKIVTAKLSTIARMGRAFSINLFLATQRPDADIMPAQIKANIDFRIAGRCDEPLSRVLGIPDAHKLVPKDIAGRFMLYDGTLFQAYLFDEEKDIV